MRKRSEELVDRRLEQDECCGRRDGEEQRWIYSGQSSCMWGACLQRMLRLLCFKVRKISSHGNCTYVYLWQLQRHIFRWHLLPHGLSQIQFPERTNGGLSANECHAACSPAPVSLQSVETKQKRDLPASHAAGA